MNAKILTASAALAVVAAAAPAAAQETADWTGPYVGGQIGYAFPLGGERERVEFDTNLDGLFGDTVRTAAGADAFSPGFCAGAARGATPGDQCDEDEGEIAGGVHVGYDYQMGNVVAGIVAEYGRTSVTDNVSAFSTTPAFYTLTRELRDHASVRARLGYAAGNTMAYVTGGGAWGRIRNSFTTNNAVNSFAENGDEDAWGYRVGGGLEHQLGRNFSLGLLYAYTSLDADEHRVRAAGPAPATNPFIRVNSSGTDFRRSDESFDTHAVSLTASFRF